MKEKRSITPDEQIEAPELPISIPDFNGASHPFSRGQWPELYTEPGLEKVAKSNTYRTDWFLKRLCTISAIIGTEVPFVFHLPDGQIRSLDAGCVGFLVNLREPRLSLRTNEDGYIVAVSPTEKGLALSRPMIESLRSSMVAAE